MISATEHLTACRASLVLHRCQITEIVVKTSLNQDRGSLILQYRQRAWDHPATHGCAATLIWLNAIIMCTLVNAWHCIHKTLAHHPAHYICFFLAECKEIMNFWYIFHDASLGPCYEHILLPYSTAIPVNNGDLNHCAWEKQKWTSTSNTGLTDGGSSCPLSGKFKIRYCRTQCRQTDSTELLQHFTDPIYIHIHNTNTANMLNLMKEQL